MQKKKNIFDKLGCPPYCIEINLPFSIALSICLLDFIETGGSPVLWQIKPETNRDFILKN